MPTCRSIGSNLWGPAVPGTVNTLFQDWEAWIPTTSGSKIWKHRFQCLGTASSWNWEPVRKWLLTRGDRSFSTHLRPGEVRKLAGLG